MLDRQTVKAMLHKPTRWAVLSAQLDSPSGWLQRCTGWGPSVPPVTRHWRLSGRPV